MPRVIWWSYCSMCLVIMQYAWLLLSLMSPFWPGLPLIVSLSHLAEPSGAKWGCSQGRTADRAVGTKVCWMLLLSPVTLTHLTHCSPPAVSELRGETQRSTGGSASRADWTAWSCQDGRAQRGGNSTSVCCFCSGQCEAFYKKDACWCEVGALNAMKLGICLGWRFLFFFFSVASNTLYLKN